MTDGAFPESIQAMLLRDEQAHAIAADMVRNLEPFRALPERVGEALILGWGWRVMDAPVSPSAALEQLRDDLAACYRALRARLFVTPNLTAARVAVLMHLALLIGPADVLRMRDLWDSLQSGDLEAAHDALLLSQWPALIANDQAAKRRALALLRAMRSGEFDVPSPVNAGDPAP